MPRLALACALVLGLTLSGCAAPSRPPCLPDPLVEDNRHPQQAGGPGAWLDKHPVLETATFALATVGVLTLAGIAVVAVELGNHHGNAFNIGP
jgi:hypothetical protein